MSSKTLNKCSEKVMYSHGGNEKFFKLKPWFASEGNSWFGFGNSITIFSLRFKVNRCCLEYKSTLPNLTYFVFFATSGISLWYTCAEVAGENLVKQPMKTADN